MCTYPLNWCNIACGTCYWVVGALNPHSPTLINTCPTNQHSKGCSRVAIKCCCLSSQLRVGQDSDSDGAPDPTTEAPDPTTSKTTSCETTPCDNPTPDPFQRNSDPTPDAVSSESGDQVAATLPRSFPRQQVQYEA